MAATGVSAYDRSATIRALVTGNINPRNWRPGIFFLYGHENGVLGRDGHTEALLDRQEWQGLTWRRPIEILNQDGTMARLLQLLEIAEKFHWKIIAIKDIQDYQKNIYKVDMALNQRRVKILDLIREDGHAKVQELSRIFNVTDVTIRQDLEALEKLGYIQENMVELSEPMWAHCKNRKGLQSDPY